MGRNGSVTVVDVAKEACVSVATVSRVINNSETVTQETVGKVRQAIEKLAYTPNVTARNLRRHESHMILVLAPNFTNPFYAHILNGISEAAQACGYSAFVSGYKESDPEDLLYNMLETRQADGAILLASTPEFGRLETLSKRYPIVQCAEYIDNANISAVSIDNYAAMREAVAHLLSIGHRRIGLITSNNNYISTLQRERGYYDAISALTSTGIRSAIAYAAEDYTFESGVKAMSELLDDGNPPTVVACVSDVLALGAIAEIRRRGLSVPGDISVMGFDDVDYTKMFHPFLSTVAQPCYDLGCRSVELLCELMQNGREPRRIVLPHKVKIRESTGALTQ